MTMDSSEVLHLKMRAQQGTVVTDSSRWGNDGTIANSAPWKSQGISFDGVNQSIACGNASSLQLANMITVAAMVQTNTSLEQAIIDKCDDGDTPTKGYALRVNASGVAVFVTNSDEYPSGVQIDDGRMHHVVGILDGTNKTIIIDGVVAATKAYSTVIVDSGQSLQIGNNYKGELFFNGVVDAVCVLSRGQSTRDAVNNYTSIKYQYVTPVVGAVVDVFTFSVNNTQVISGLFSTTAGETISVDWGDGSARSTYSGVDQAWSKDYGIAGDRTVRLFGSGVLTTFVMDAAGADISFDITNLPAGVTYLAISGSNTIADYTTPHTWTTKPATFILIPVGAGGLSEAEVDQLLIDFDDDLVWAAGNVITLTGTNAARSAASDVAVANMVAEGAAVTTN